MAWGIDSVTTASSTPALIRTELPEPFAPKLRGAISDADARCS